MKYCINVPEYTFVDTPCVYEVVEVKEPIRVVEVKTREQEWKEARENYCYFVNKYWKQPKVKKCFLRDWFAKPEVEKVTVVDRYTILY